MKKGATKEQQALIGAVISLTYEEEKQLLQILQSKTGGDERGRFDS